jgi:hypothetical protein
MYHVEVSPDFICSVTGVVMSDVTAWQARPLEPIYPLVFFDVLTARDGSNRRTSGNPSRSARWQLLALHVPEVCLYSDFSCRQRHPHIRYRPHRRCFVRKRSVRYLGHG